MKTGFGSWVVLLLAATACEPPAVYSTADKRQNTQLSRLEGNVVVSSAARGNVVVFLFSADRLPPPEGTGRPVAFTVVSQNELFHGAPPGERGPFTAPFAFSLVAPGRYVLRAFLDANGDFIPWYGVTAEVNTGDVGGGAVDPVTRAFRVFEVTTSGPTTDVPVSISDAATVSVDRPVFSVAGTKELTLTPGSPRVVQLTVSPINDGTVRQPKPLFLARFVDDDNDGAPDDANGDGVPEMWPRVVVRKLSNDNLLLDENDLDKNSILDATGADYEKVDPKTGASIAPDGVPDLVVLAAGFDPTSLAPLLIDSMTGRVKTAPTPINSLNLVIRPTAFDATNPRAPAPLKSLPSGRYAVVIIQQTGQTWRLPNELSPDLAGRTGLTAEATQAFVVTVP